MASQHRMEDDSTGDVFLNEGPCLTIAEHALQCTSLFHEYISEPEIVPDPVVLDDQQAHFALWAADMDVYGQPNASLDSRLRFSPTAVDMIHQLLDVICETLKSLKPIDNRPLTPSTKGQRMSRHGDPKDTRRAYDDSSDFGIDVGQAEKNLLKITDAIDETVTRLFQTSNAAQKSARANRDRTIGKYQDNEADNAVTELSLYTERYIRFRFPMAPDSLRSALVEANAMRLRRLYYQRTHRRLIEVLAAEFTPEDPRAESVVLNNKLSSPPVPPTQECPYCGYIVEFKSSTTSSLWQNHVIKDLEPFICVFPDCLEAGHQGHEAYPLTFETSAAWSSHMQTAHGHKWECRAPSHNLVLFDKEIQYQEHVIKEHDVPEARAATLSNAALRTGLDKVLKCPFGDDFQHSGEVQSSTVFSSEALQSHVASHMKEIALLALHALQNFPSDDDGNAGNAKVADGSVGHRGKEISAR